MPTENHLGSSSRNRASMKPPIWLWILLGVLVGGLAGFGGFTFQYARGSSYLSDNPAACVNCHVMRDVYDAWNHGSHKAVATCNDCHTPEGFLGHWKAKGINGFKHSSAFTLGGFHEPIRIAESDRDIARDNCLRCHGDLTAWMDCRNGPEPTDCLHCHSGIGHDE